MCWTSTQTQINMFSKNKINFGYREEFDKRMLKANKKYFMRALNSIQKQVHPNKKVTISLVILPDSIVKEMNKEYRGVDKATDVLSFPLGTEHKGVIDLGDVVVGKMK
ncbi:MAG: hypothetical protein DRP42_00990 [Tenericutes bacterium]|nr:MAG: hypothetical protein DRP42_00990 [Mycoplasmatota bacterium]